MLLNVIPTDGKQTFYVHCKMDDSTEVVTKKVLETHNYYRYLMLLKDLLKDLRDHGQLRNPEARGLSELFEGEVSFGPKQDPQKYRDGHAPDENGQRLLTEAIQKIDLLGNFTLNREPLLREDLDNTVAIIKGSLMIIYPEHSNSHDSVFPALDQLEDYIQGKFNDEGFINVEAGAVFFASKCLIQKGETMRSLNCNDNSTVKVTPSKSANFCPRTNEDAAKYETMKYMFEKQKKLKEAELMTEDDAYGAAWADKNSLKGQLQGMQGGVKFK